MIRIFNHYVPASALRGVVFDVLLILLILLVALSVQLGGVAAALPAGGTHVVSFAACIALVGTATGLYGAQGRGTWSSAAARAVLVLLVALPLAVLTFGMLPGQIQDGSLAQLTAIGGVSALVVRRAYLTHATGRTLARSRLLVFGAGPAALAVTQALADADPNAQIVGYVAGPNEREIAVPPHMVLACEGTLPQLAHQMGIDEIVVALTERRAGSMPLRQLLDCKASGVQVCDLNTHFEKTLGQIRVDFLNASWLIFGDGFNQGAWRTGVKRVFDVFCAMVLLLLALPLMVVTAVLIRLESPGGIFYRQERVGLNGRGFDVIKFRSMRNDAEKDGRPVWATTNDARVTRVGAVIRKLRIDELPQLINVLRGDMSLVGPRPERPFFVDQLTQEIPFYALRHSIKPGVTGWAQVRYPYGATVEDSQQKLQYDLYYVKNHTLFLDLVVLMETVGVVLTGKGAR